MLTLNPDYMPLYILIFSSIISAIGFLFQYFFGKQKPPKGEIEAEVEKEEVQTDRRTTMPKLQFHPVFRELDEQESYFTTRYRHNDLGRQTLASEMIVRMIRIWRPILMDFALKVEDCCSHCGGGTKPNCNKVYNLAIESYLRGMEDYIDWHTKTVVMSNDGQREYRPVDKDTMDVYIDKFQEWHSLREELLRIMMHEIGESNLYEDCRKRAWDILQGYTTMFIGMKLDAEKSLRALNGGLTGKEFLGITIGDFD